MKQLKNNRGEGQISVGVKIILAVVIGALILGGLYLLFDCVILRNTDRQIKELMVAGGSSEVLEVRTTDDRALLTSLSYTHDGETWIPSEIPTYAKDAKVLTLASGGTADAPVTLCVIRSDNNVVALYSTDEGRSFREGKRWTFTGKYGARMKWNAETQRFEGEIRINQSGNLLWTKDGITWKLLNAPIHYFN